MTKERGGSQEQPTSGSVSSSLELLFAVYSDSSNDEFSEEEEGSNAPAVLKSNETRLEPSILFPM